MRYVPCCIFFSLISISYAAELPLLIEEDFESGIDKWELLDPDSWKVAEREGDHVLSQHVKQASYNPPHRSPFHLALLEGPIVADFELTARVRSTHEDYPHRDACLFFGYQDSAHFYYVHLGQSMDPHANQIFIVNGADRTKISTKTTDGTPWDDDWHQVRIVRESQSGKIEIYWDDQKEPVMTATDKNFTWGRVGVGSFDDTADWDDITLRGVVPKPDAKQGLPIQQSQRRE